MRLCEMTLKNLSGVNENFLPFDLAYKLSVEQNGLLSQRLPSGSPMDCRLLLVVAMK
jgi:hypothetical protein